MEIQELETMTIFTKQITKKNSVQIVKDEYGIWVKNINASARAWRGSNIYGNHFNTWNDAIANYKNQKMKSAIRLASEFLI